MPVHIYGIHPLIVFLLALVGGYAFFVSIFTLAPFNAGAPIFQLAKSQAFAAIVECTDTANGVGCFSKHRGALKKEARGKLSVISQAQIEDCLDLASKNANDLALILNIQTCFHQADILERATQFNRTSNTHSWWSIIGVSISLFIQVFIALHGFITFVLRSKETEKQNTTIRNLAENAEHMNEKQISIYKSVSSLTSSVNSETKNLQGRLNKGGDVRRELERVSLGVAENFEDIQKLKSLVAVVEEEDENSRIAKKWVSSGNRWSYPASSLSPAIPKNFGGLSERLENIPQLIQNSQDRNGCEVNNGTSSHPLLAKLGDRVFDLASPKGIEEWRNYVRNMPKSKSPRSVPKTSNPPRVPFAIGEFTSALSRGEIHIKKYNKAGQPHRRLFLPGRGWITAKRLEEEGIRVHLGTPLEEPPENNRQG
ncbi:hypothetical protein BABINDRAFT_57997 [Babjeviella inositovora NRRL Y-12698]|uniref:Karyogamy protein 5 n=1 Tax=Babjeviella inositovora NRRL Y-12698 TaxID=984486 RepID=A0A1E3QV49_9ASCO|nr:uncharacterized protein BABINDRAFT_57997 [Babjeviella inositovora NRRL Y-12698]ODQ81551.1 hypothetical protein BABINDRAFT_57997 [Babjeviella inositovora NRRL Y-12698]